MGDMSTCRYTSVSYKSGQLGGPEWRLGQRGNAHSRRSANGGGAESIASGEASPSHTMKHRATDC